MANIQKLTYPYFTDNETRLEANTLNPIIQKLNEVIDKVNGGVTPTQTVATPTISISGTTATISCSTSGATIYYTTNGNTPTTSSTQYSSPITLSGACTIKAIAVKSGMNNSSVASKSYTPSPYESETDAIFARYTKSLSDAQKTAFNTFIVTLKTNSLLSKIDCMILPFMASNITEATQNALTGNSAFAANRTSLTLASNGIAPTIGEVTALLDITEDGRDFHISGYNNNSPTLDSKPDVFYGSYVDNLKLGNGVGGNGGSTGAYFKMSDGNSAWLRKIDSNIPKEAKKIFTFSFGSSASYLCIKNEVIEGLAKYETGNLRGIHQFGQYLATSVATTNPETFSEVYHDPTGEGNTCATRFIWGFISWGKAFTSAQCQTFNTAVETMMASFIS